MKNLSKTLLKLNDDSALLESISLLRKLKERDGISEDLVKVINDAMAAILTQYHKLPSDLDQIYKQVLSCIVQDENSTNRHEYYKKYLKLLYKCEDIDKLMFEATKMHQIFIQDIYPLGKKKKKISIGHTNIIYIFFIL